MGYMFNGCNELKEIKGIDKFNTSKVTNMIAMFSECNKLEQIEIKNFKTSNVNNMMMMFSNCQSLKKLPDISA